MIYELSERICIANGVYHRDKQSPIPGKKQQNRSEKENKILNKTIKTLPNQFCLNREI